MNGRRRTWRFWTGWLAVIGAAGAGGTFVFLQSGKAAARTDLPTAQARQGEFQVIVSCRGEMVAGKSVLITAPLNVPNLQIVWMATPGAPVKAGEIVVRFDASGAKRQLQEKEAALRQAQASLDEAVAQAKIKLEQDRLEIASQKHLVERAKLEVSKQEIVAALQAEQSKIDLGLAEEKLKVLEATLSLNQASSQSKIASLSTQRNKSKAEMDLTVTRIAQMEVKAPSEGILSFLMNYSQGWINARPFRVGDNVWPGSSIAEIPDVRTLQMKGKVEEIDRGRLQPGQDVRVLLDPFPEKPFKGKLEGVSALTEQNFEWPPSKNFRAFAALDEKDGRLRPAMNGRLDIIVDRLANAVSVPAKAVFARQGKPVVLVPGPDGLRPVFVEVMARNPDEVAVKGLAAGTRVALVDHLPGEKKKS